MLYFVYLGSISFIATAPYLIMSYFLYFTTDLGKDAFYMPFRPWIAFCAFSIDFRTPIGYLINMCEQTLVVGLIVVITGSELFFQFGSCWILKSLAKDVHLELETLNWLHKLEIYKYLQQHKQQTHQQYIPKMINESEQNTRICAFIHFHSTSKQ